MQKYRPIGLPGTASMDRDVGLLKRIAQQRDEVAFKELYERYEGPAFNLAMHLCRQRELAQDVIQEVMLSLWKRAHTFEVARSSSVRSWILAIVFRESMRRLRDKKNWSRFAERSAEISLESKQDSEVVVNTEKREELNAIRHEMRQLKPKEQQILSLYFGAGCSQREIGEAMDLPQRTVSYNLEKALGQLRQQMSAAGLASVALTADGPIRTALCALEDVPVDLSSNVFSRIHDHATFARTSTQSHALHKRPTQLMAGIVLIVGLAAGFYFISSDRQSDLPAKTTAQPAATESSHAFWFSDFENGIPPEIHLIRGNWKLVKAEHKGSTQGLFALTTQGSTQMQFALPDDSPAEMVLTFDLWGKDDQQAGPNMELFWRNPDDPTLLMSTVSTEVLFLRPISDFYQKRTLKLEIYCNEAQGFKGYSIDQIPTYFTRWRNVPEALQGKDFHPCLKLNGCIDNIRVRAAHEKDREKWRTANAQPAYLDAISFDCPKLDSFRRTLQIGNTGYVHDGGRHGSGAHAFRRLPNFGAALGLSAPPRPALQKITFDFFTTDKEATQARGLALAALSMRESWPKLTSQNVIKRIYKNIKQTVARNNDRQQTDWVLAANAWHAVTIEIGKQTYSLEIGGRREVYPFKRLEEAWRPLVFFPGQCRIDNLKHSYREFP